MLGHIRDDLGEGVCVEGCDVDPDMPDTVQEPHEDIKPRDQRYPATRSGLTTSEAGAKLQDITDAPSIRVPAV